MSEHDSLRAHAGWRVLDGFGRAVRSASRYAVPRTVAELPDLLAGARADGLAVSFRGAGRSYGDASLNQNGLAIDTTALDRVIAWDDGHEDDYAPRKAREDVKSGLKRMRDDVVARQDEIRRTRSENGLPNRNP